MKSFADTHLNDNQLLWAVVDEEELTPAAREHIQFCPGCAGALEEMRRDLEQLGDRAEELRPASTRRIVPPPREARKPPLRALWGRRPAFQLAVTAILVFVVLWWTGSFRSGSTGKSADLLPATWKSDPVMAEVDRLVENALPTTYRDISGESYSGFDDGFIQFVVPAGDSEPFSFHSDRKGAFTC